MSDRGSIEQILSGRPQAVDVDAVEQELQALWRSVSEAQAATGEEDVDGGPSTPPVARACMANLVVFAADPDLADHAGQAIARLAQHAPARAIVVVDQGPADNGSAMAWIQAHCRRPYGRSKQRPYYICSEQITVAAPRQQVAELHSLVFSLFVSDLPACLWWLGPLPTDPAHRHLFHALAENCDLVVFNSRSFPDPLGDLVHMRWLGAQLPQGVAYTDLSWVRIHAWRELLARLFDDHDRLAFLPHLDGAVLRYGVDPDAPRGLPRPVGAVMLAAWLAERLDWSVESPLQLSPQGVGAVVLGRVPLELVPGALPDPDACTIIGVELTAQADEILTQRRRGTEKEKERIPLAPLPLGDFALKLLFHHRDVGGAARQARFRIERLGDGRWVRSQARIGQQVALERVAQFPALHDGHLLAQALDRPGPDVIFLRALDKVCEMVG